MGSQQTLTGPDLARGVALDSLEEDEPLLGHFQEEAVLLVRRGTAIFAAGAVCTHYSGPLAEGLVARNQIAVHAASADFPRPRPERMVTNSLSLRAMSAAHWCGQITGFTLPWEYRRRVS